MWLWIFIGFSITSKLYGYIDGRFPEACDSMSPVHMDKGSNIPPQTSPPPFMVEYQLGQSIRDPVTVTLRSTESIPFIGFMLQARVMSLVEEGPPVGKFISLDSRQTRLLTCRGLPDSSVSHRLNSDKTSFKVNWTAQGEEQDIIFRATFSQSFKVFWERVDSVSLRLTSTPVHSTTEPTTTSPVHSTTAPTTSPVHGTTEPTTTTSPVHGTTAPTTSPVHGTTEPTTTSPVHGTTEPTTSPVHGTTEPTTTSPVHGTTEPTTTTRTEQLSSTTITTMNSSTGLTTSTIPQHNIIDLELAGIALMCLDGVLEEVKMKMSNVFMILTGNRESYNKHNKILMAVCSMLGVINLFWSFVFFAITSSYKVKYLALAGVVLGLNFIEWVITLLPLRYSSDLNGICDLVVRMCYVPHRICTNALIFLGVIASVDNWGENRMESWLLIVIIADTVWILLTLIWDFGLTVHKRLIQKKPTIENLQHTGYGSQENKKTAFQVTGTIISVMFMVGTTAFSVAVIVGLIQRK